MIKVKICGITNYDDAAMAVKLGADALGFIFALSPRKISPEKARDIISKLPPFIKSVGVFVNEDPYKINEMIKYCGIDNVQLHGAESPELCEKYMPRTIKALRVKDEAILKQVPLFIGKVKAFLLDTYSEKKAGGTGKIFDWGIANNIRDYDIPVILAGGLTPSNIEEAVQKVNPYGVDVNSGIEESPGKKSPVLMKELFEKINYIKRRQKSECRSQE